MATELLLLSDVEHLGKAGDLVKVADGYARNYLLPQDLAAPATKNALRRLEKLRKEREELERKEIAAAQVVADQLKDLAAVFGLNYNKAYLD
jgi:large subunit ribosomal protein L9